MRLKNHEGICNFLSLISKLFIVTFLTFSLPMLGEYVVKADGIVDELSSGGSVLAEEEPSSLIDLPEFSLEEALQLVGLDEDSTEVGSN
jgi:hypothetical protein